MTDETRPVIQAFNPRDEDEILLEVELVQGQFVWRFRGRVIDGWSERSAAVDHTLHAYVGHHDFMALLTTLYALDRWCQRHGTGKKNE